MSGGAKHHSYIFLMQTHIEICNPGIGTNIFYKLLYDKPQMIMLLSGCSSVSTPVAEAARLWNLIVVSYGSSSPALSNRKRFPTFFRTHPSATLNNPARIKMCQEFGWKKIAVLQETQEVFTSTIEDLEKRAKKANIEIVSRQSFLTDPDNAVGDLLREDARIIVGVFYEGMARKVFCEAYKKKLYGPKIVWFLIGWYPDNWYAEYDPNINCTADELKIALENHFTTEGMMLSPDPTPSISGMNAEIFKERMAVALHGKNPSDVTGYPESPLSYDAVWAIALALNKTSNSLAERGLSLESYTYGNKQVADEIYSALNSSRFKGLSGTVVFSSTGDRLATMQIERMINGTYHKLAYYDIVQDNLTWVMKATWPGGKIPKDGVQEIIEYQLISKKLYIPVCILCSIIIIFAFIFLVFNILFSHTQYLECSQAGVNNIMVLGCLLCLMCVFLFGLDGQYLENSMVQLPKICQSTTWLLSIGFSLGYGALFGKIWMVHQLITKEKNVKDDKTKRRKVSIEIVPTWKIYTLIGVKVILDIVILIIWQSIDPLTLKPKSFGTKDDKEKDEKIKEVLEMCESNSLKIWLGTLYAINGLLLLFGIFLAYETRNMAVRDINDSKYVAMAIYNVVVLCIITAPVTSIIRTQPNAVFGFVSFSIIICCAITLGIIFVPKILYLNKNPSGDYNKAYLQHLPSKEDTEKQIKLTSENEGIKRQIAEKEEHIRHLTGLIEQKVKKRSLADGDDKTTVKSKSGNRLAPGKISPGQISFDDSAFVSTYTNSGTVVTNIGVKINAPHGSDEEFSETYL
ncbi:gamma-aminobutyric acid type B receptor subunit 1-like [Anneissia japonica]|uniref:gamma-aminobutyric acid type B receptor subunit 1-like n=1 Tax=Anneissia japonica TaxID=1529436 RepID=UPI00142560B7|nr:gamma-aminobutyric acid type B receptor subunit 1-like [Anneissia japonica]